MSTTRITNIFRNRRLGTLIVSLCLLSVSACVSTEPRQLAPSVSLSTEQPELTDMAANTRTPAVNFGLTATVNESDSLTNISILPGIRVRTISPGGAVDRAGIRAGDVILSIDGAPTNQPDVLDALALETSSDRSFEFEVRRNTTVFMANVNVQVTSLEQLPPVELYRADPVLLRAGFTSTRTIDSNQQPVFGAQLIRWFEHSPLPGAGLQSGDIILALDQQTITSAQDLISRLNNNYSPGDKVTLQVRRGSQLMSQQITLWHPGRRLSQLSLWPLFRYESSLNPDQTRLRIGDLLLVSLFQYQRTGAEQQYDVLGLFRASTGFGELIEE
jgi:serine protease Do